MTVLGKVVHPRLLTSFGGLGDPFYLSTCTIQAATDTAGSTGEITQVWADVAGLVSLPCNIAPVSISERRGTERTVELGTHKVYLQAYYATVTAMQHAIVDGVTYNILSVEQDSQSAVTVLRVEVVQ